MLLGSIEAGGTKFVCAVGNEKYQIIEQETFSSKVPEQTLKETVEFFKRFPELDAIGIAAFGPVEVRLDQANYGVITNNTPKIAWRNVNLVKTIKDAIDVPVFITSDVNGSAYGEYVVAKQRGEKIDSVVYYTVGTGIGAGIVIDGHFIGALGLQEMGHVKVKRHPDDLAFGGLCPHHGDCLEGLASGPTFEARTGKNGKDVPLDDPSWDIMAYYLAQAAVQTTLTVRPNKIVFGGGVLSPKFLDMIRKHFDQELNGYVDIPPLDKYLMMPEAENNGSATVGDFELARKVLIAGEGHAFAIDR